AILDALNGGIVILNEDERIVHWNAWMTSATGLSLAEVQAKSLGEIFPGLDSRRLRIAIRGALESNAAAGISHALNASPLPLRTQAGRTLLHDITESPVTHNGKACVLCITDVTMAGRREQFLRDQQRARYNAVVESAPDAIMTNDGAGKIQMANPAAVQQFGYSMEELVG